MLTTIANELAQKIAARPDLRERSARIIRELDSAALIAATHLQGYLLRLMKQVFDPLPADALYETPVLINASS